MTNGQRLCATALLSPILAASCLPAQAFAWGAEGHKVVAMIATGYLAPQVRAKVSQLLQDDHDTLSAPDFASRATWADRWREQDRSTAPWHYNNLDLAAPDLQAACRQACNVAKINQFAAELADSRTPEREQIFALKMILHLVGDLHQPLHDAISHQGGRSDSGGNCEHVVYTDKAGFPRTLSLHAYWDDAAVEALGDTAPQIAQRLRRTITPYKVQQWAAGRPEDWAYQGYQIAATIAYRYGGPAACNAAPTRLTRQYEQAAAQVSSVQLQAAGVRLAVILNRSLGPHQ
jgi:hypothetical protein